MRLPKLYFYQLIRSSSTAGKEGGAEERGIEFRSEQNLSVSMCLLLSRTQPH